MDGGTVTDYYLSRVELNARKRGARQLLMSPQAMHAAVESSLPPSARRVGERFLWRVDRYGARNDLYVVSPGAPDFTHVVEQAGWVVEGDVGWLSRPYDRLLDRLEAGQLWAFRLAANPTHMGRAPDGSMKRFGHVTAQQQLDWLLVRAERHGFSIPVETDGIPALEIIARHTLRFARGRSERKVTINQAVYEGVLRAEDPESLRFGLTQGIGRAKAYGCGLMTLAPLPLVGER